MSELAVEFVLPILTGLIAWFANAYRNKQRKEKDVLDNVQQLIKIENDFLADMKGQLDASRRDLRKLEAKYDHKVRAVKEAYDCEHEEHCPVLEYDKGGHLCETCELRNPDCER